MNNDLDIVYVKVLVEKLVLKLVHKQNYFNMNDRLAKYKAHALKEGSKVIEVTIKRTYITYPHEPMSDEDMKKEWFGDIERSHAYRDGSRVGNSDEVLEVKFLKL